MSDKINLYRRNGKLIYIKMPEFNELYFVKELWGNKKNMGDFGEVYSFPEEKWKMFYKKMVSPTDGKNFYCLIYDLKDNPVGEVSFHGYNSATKVARINLKIHYEHRRKGYGEEALRLLLEYYFFEFGGQTIIESVKTNEGKSILKRIGFEELNNIRDQWTYKLTKDKFISRKITNKVSIAILAYDDVDITEYAIPINIFNKFNEVVNEEYFTICSISNNNYVKYKYGTIDVNYNINDTNIYPDILIIPGGSGIIETVKDETLLKCLTKMCCRADYLVIFSNAINLLSELINIKGLTIPNTKYIVDGFNIDNKKFIDNGKIMISDNLISHIQLCLNIIKKISGYEISDKIAKELGYKNNY